MIFEWTDIIVILGLAMIGLFCQWCSFRCSRATVTAPWPETQTKRNRTKMKLAIAITATAFVIAIGGFSMARNSAALCDLDKDYYARNAAWCDGAMKVPGLRQHLHRRSTQQELRGSFMDGDDTVTVRRDPQATTDTGNPDPFIAFQTADDVAKSQAYGSAGGWYVSQNDMWRKHPVVKMAAAPRPAAKKTVTTTVTRVVAEQ